MKSLQVSFRKSDYSNSFTGSQIHCMSMISNPLFFGGGECLSPLLMSYKLRNFNLLSMALSQYVIKTTNLGVKWVLIELSKFYYKNLVFLISAYYSSFTRASFRPEFPQGIFVKFTCVMLINVFNSPDDRH